MANEGKERVSIGTIGNLAAEAASSDLRHGTLLLTDAHYLLLIMDFTENSGGGGGGPKDPRKAFAANKAAISPAPY